MEDLQERINHLEQELGELRAVLRYTPLVGAAWSVVCGGEVVQLRALTPVQWVGALDELPAFLFAYVQGTTEDNEKVLEKLATTAKSWLLACAVEPKNLSIERLTIPEALEAVKKIASLNGIDTALASALEKKMRFTLSTAPPSATG
jgi:hypothetical protein